MDTEFDAIAQTLGLGPAANVWRADWQRSAQSFDPAGLWLTRPGAAAEACGFLRMGAEPGAALVGAWEAVRANPPLLRLLWHVHYCLLLSKTSAATPGAPWPAMPEALGSAGRCFYALAYLLGLPTLRTLHGRLGVGEDVTIATLADLELRLREYRSRRWEWGLDHTWWLRFHFTGKLYALGRLQFEMMTSPLPVRVYRAIAGEMRGQVLALAEEGSRLRADGQFADADGGAQAGSAWTARLRAGPREVVGHAVSQRGGVQRQATSLRSDEWEQVLAPGDPVLSVHIPASGRMDDAACEVSFRAALAFFPRHFPQLNARAFVCISWLLDPQLADHLPASSNIVRFLSRFRLLPQPGADDAQTFERVFGGKPQRIESAPRDTALRRAVLAHVEQGGRWRMGAGYRIVEGG